jgi:acyl-CoA synthetase (NDP forming)
MDSLTPLFRPRALAVIGASRDPDSIPGCLFANLHQSFAGTVYPVNPNAQIVQGVTAYASVLEIPEPIDLAFIAVPAHTVLTVAQQCIEKLIPALVVVSAGFAETGEAGAAREQTLLQLARSTGTRILGPNCFGVINTDPGIRLNGVFSPVVVTPGNISLGMQSGALGFVIPEALAGMGAGIFCFASLGNKADITETDLLEYWQQDPDTHCIGLYLESFKAPRRFLELAPQVARHKPVIVLKGARTITGALAASSHTAAQAGPAVAADALLTQTGIIQTSTLQEMIGTTALLATQPLPRGPRVAVVSNAGGPAVLCADALGLQGLTVIDFPTELRQELQTFLPSHVTLHNPLDLIASVDPRLYQQCLERLLRSNVVDAVIVIFVPRQPGVAADIARAIHTAAKNADGSKPVLAVFTQTDPPLKELHHPSTPIPCYRFPEPAAAALARAVRYRQWLVRPEGKAPQFADLLPEVARQELAIAYQRLGNRGGWLLPAEAEQVLAAFGLPTPSSRVATTADEAVSAAREMGGPVVLKVISPTVLHKSDLGGVVLNVAGEDAVKKAFCQVTEAVADTQGALIQPFIPGGQEVLLGINRDASFGPLVAFGIGGVLVDLLESVAVRLAPLTNQDVEDLIGAGLTRRVLEGYRGSPSADIAAVKAALLRVSAMAEVLPEIVEMDLNPIKVFPPGEGLLIVDARIRVAPY